LDKKALGMAVWMVVVGASMWSVASNATSFQTLDKTQNGNIKKQQSLDKNGRARQLIFFPISNAASIISFMGYVDFFQSVTSEDQKRV
jgi:hypothetical protein